MVLRVNDCSEMARLYARHDKDQWRRFLNITHEEAQDLISTVNRWTDMPPNKKAELRQRVNELLDSEDIPQVDSDIMNWRMPKAFKKIARSGDTPSPGEASRSVNQPEARQLPWDPVRDSMQG